MERDTFERLMEHPTWPTEWASHMVFIAYSDWMQTGDKDWLAQHYEWLKTKLLQDRVQADGLVHSNIAQMEHDDIVDWPKGERDGYVFTPVNTVVNAFSLRALDDMRQLALALGNTKDAAFFAQQHDRGLASFQKLLFDEQTGFYRDGIDTGHSSEHANLFPLAFGLVPQSKRAHIATWLAGRGMQVSVYAAQYLLEGLFLDGDSKQALDLITAPGDRSWKHMVESGTTITWEAWDQHYKPNQDWNHAWGAAPANLLPRFVLGVRASKPGWKEATIQPHPGDLTFATGTIPAPAGEISVSWKRTSAFILAATLPSRLPAKVLLPAFEGSRGAWKDGHPIAAHREGDWWILKDDIMGRVSLEER
jgi:alpha-L-rhamnosidase